MIETVAPGSQDGWLVGTTFVALSKRPPWGATFEYDANGWFVVSDIETGGLAEQAGLRKGLVLHSVNEKCVLGKKNAGKALSRKPPLHLALFPSPGLRQNASAAAEPESEPEPTAEPAAEQNQEPTARP